MKPQNIAETLDLSGVICPENAALILLKLAGLDKGSILEAILDDGLPMKYVPHSVEQDGHKILSAQRMDKKWKILIQKI